MTAEDAQLEGAIHSREDALALVRGQFGGPEQAGAKPTPDPRGT
jgi:hypothetical protein